jgi:hypothetical protein
MTFGGVIFCGVTFSGVTFCRRTIFLANGKIVSISVALTFYCMVIFKTLASNGTLRYYGFDFVHICRIYGKKLCDLRGINLCTFAENAVGIK